MWSKSAELLRDFAGEGMIVTIFLLSVIWLFVVEKRKEVRIIFVYMPATVLFLFFFPLTAKIMDTFLGEEIYYRLLWLWPVVLTVSYAVVQLWRNVKEKSRMLVVVVVVMIIVLSGKMMYTSPHYSLAENQYHVPQEVVDICDDIRIDGREVMALFPKELVQYVRQYDATICMPFGREAIVYTWGIRDELFYALEEEIIQVDRVATMAKERLCHYVVLSKKDTLNGDFEDYRYELLGEYGEYLVYKDTTMYFGLWNEE